MDDHPRRGRDADNGDSPPSRWTQRAHQGECAAAGTQSHVASAAQQAQRSAVGVGPSSQDVTTGSVEADRHASLGETIGHPSQLAGGGDAGGPAERHQHLPRVLRLDDQACALAADVGAAPVDGEVEIGLEAHATDGAFVSDDGRCRWW
jgi:hypothetical protein